MAHFKDELGNMHGKLTVIARFPKNTAKKQAQWVCRCECGNLTVKHSQELRGVQEPSCGCYLKTSKKDITGQKFGKLTAIRCTGKKNNQNNFIWEFLCDCGNTHISSAGNIVFKGGSCGCQLKESAKLKENYHGMKDTAEYKAWCHIKDRCYNPKSKSYADYGALGITFDEFKDDFLAFYEYMGDRPSDGKKYSVDRIDNNRGYVRGNMRWADTFEQARNKGMMKCNTSGINGVVWDNKQHPCGTKRTLYAKAQWYSMEGKNRTKCFSTKKYGLLEAFAMACKYREKMIKELEAQGIVFSPNHGKPKSIITD